VQEHVIISHRGARYEVGRGPGCYGIWPAGAAHLYPIEWWPETADGWRDAWSRFTDLERPRKIHPVGPYANQSANQDASQGANQSASQDASQAGSQDAGQDLGPGRTVRRTVVPAALLAAGVGAGIGGLFGGYFGGTSLAAQAAEVVPHVIYLAAWAVSAVLILLGGARAKVGALLAAGTSAVTFGLFLADAGTAITGGVHLVGSGLVLSLAGWLACAAGSAVALWLGRAGAPRSPRSVETAVTIALAAVAAIGTAVAFVPSWDSFTLRTAAGATQSVTEGYAFANPGLVIAGNVAVLATLVAVVLAASIWRPVRYGAALLAGATIPMAAQAISAVIQVGGGTSPLQFGLTPDQAARIGLTISSGLTPAFWVYCGFVVALMLTCALMLVTPAAPPPAPGPARGAEPDAASPAAQTAWPPREAWTS
jgi:hypothetical protein